ncbi:MAG: S-methyl-5-thioribose-1-phosphate isomerase [Desulfobacteraceae bacterium]|nr:S-methyl-5-thioribose-1-phosphate isomerase [Desulfobacteraceae bacterium]MBC2757173.1 S-methyl-5-thioribose-1-phosphate isomerase [Desulfobacteraceae bacterium]
MNKACERFRPIWIDHQSDVVKVIDQRALPHEQIDMELNSVEQVIFAIKEMVVRGAPLIGVTGAYGIFVALKNDKYNGDETYIKNEAKKIINARPTAVNLSWGVNRMLTAVLSEKNSFQRVDIARQVAGEIAEEEVENSKNIGQHGVKLIEEIAREKPGKPVNILTHCNAGSLACIEYGTATAPIYAAWEMGINVHVWVDETRPLNQGARLTAWELGKSGVPHTVITDNAGGHLMQHNMVDMVIVGTDRSTYTGDVANKIGTYLKALAAKDNNIPFYVALPSSTFDWTIRDGVADIPIEVRDPDEVRYIPGAPKSHDHLLMPENSPAANYAFDVTPARLVTAFITERGVCRANEADVKQLFPEKK